MEQGTKPPASIEASAGAVGARRPLDLIGAVGAGSQDVRDEGTVHAHGDQPGLVPAFDAVNPPSLDLIDDCVHCGFCLPSCPTYLLFGQEMDSPRGRIYLMREAHEGEPLGETLVRHWDLCLGCLACQTACPSGVQYGKLITASRAQVHRRYPRSLPDRLFREAIYALFPYPGRLEMLRVPLALFSRSQFQAYLESSRLSQALPARLRRLQDVAPTVKLRRERIPEWVPAQGIPVARVGLLLGCVQRAFFAPVNAATVRVLAADGCEVVIPRVQGCCGALSAHVGRDEEAKNFARRTIDVWETQGIERLAVNVAGCGSHMKEYGYLLRDDPKYAASAQRFAEQVRDVSELLVEIGSRARRYPLELAAVYHDACHLSHGQGIREQPRRLLRAIPGLDLREVPRERDICCGSAGTYNILEPEAGRELAQRKAGHILATGAQLLVTANPGCDLQISAGIRQLGRSLPAAHVMQVVDASIRNRPAAELL